MRRKTLLLAACVLMGVLVCSTASFTQAPPQAGQTSGTGMLAGRIVDGGGSPVPAVVVALRRGGSAPVTGRAAAAAADRVMTDDAGRFVFSSLGAGRYELEATKPGWLPGAFGRKRPGGSSVAVELADGGRRNDLSISIWRAGAIGGRVIDDNGDPLVGVEVRAMRQTFIAGRPQSETPIRAKTDDTGAYRFSGLSPGSYLVAVLSSVLSEPQGFAGAQTVGAERTYYQTMAAIGSLPMLFDRATAVTGPDKPLVGTLGPMLSTPGDGAWLAYPTTFHPSSTTWKAASLVRLGAGESRSDADINMRLTQTWQVSGTLRDAEGPAAWHAMHLISAETPETPLVDTATAVTDAKGAFTFFGVPPGQFIIRVARAPWPSGTGFRFARTGGTGAIPTIGTVVESPNAGAPFSTDPLMHVSEPVTVGDRHVRNLVLTMAEGPRIKGRIRFEGSAPRPTADQLRNLLVVVWAASGRQDGTIFPGRVSPDGETFVSSSLLPGRYLVRPNPVPGWTFKDAMWRGRNISATSFDLTADIADVVITYVDQTHEITGTVQPESGQPVAGTVVILFPPDPSAWVDYGVVSPRISSAIATTNGSFRFSLPPPGDYLIVAIPDELSAEWRNPETLAKLAAIAERIRVADQSITQSLQVKRFR